MKEYVLYKKSRIVFAVSVYHIVLFLSFSDGIE